MLTEWHPCEAHRPKRTPWTGRKERMMLSPSRARTLWISSSETVTTSTPAWEAAASPLSSAEWVMM